MQLEMGKEECMPGRGLHVALAMFCPEWLATHQLGLPSNDVESIGVASRHGLEITIQELMNRVSITSSDASVALHKPSGTDDRTCFIYQPTLTGRSAFSEHNLEELS